MADHSHAHSSYSYSYYSSSEDEAEDDAVRPFRRRVKTIACASKSAEAALRALPASRFRVIKSNSHVKPTRAQAKANIHFVPSETCALAALNAATSKTVRVSKFIGATELCTKIATNATLARAARILGPSRATDHAPYSFWPHSYELPDKRDAASALLESGAGPLIVKPSGGSQGDGIVRYWGVIFAWPNAS